MKTLHPRSRTVTYRVSAEEFAALTASCIAAGARSISDFSRAAVLKKIQMDGMPEPTLSGDLSTLSRRLGELDLALLEASDRIRGVLKPASSRGAAVGASETSH